jgi:hypothetical protein
LFLFIGDGGLVSVSFVGVSFVGVSFVGVSFVGVSFVDTNSKSITGDGVDICGDTLSS